MPDAVMSAEAPRMLLRTLRRLGADATRLARGVGLDAGRLAVPGWVSAERVYALWARAERELDDPLVGAHVGFGHEVGMLGLQDSLYLTSGTLGEAIDVSIRHLASLSQVGTATLSGDDDEFVTLTTRVPAGPAALTGVQSASFGVAYQLAMARRATGVRVRPHSVGFVHPAPRSHRALAAALGAGQVRFGEPVTTVTFRRTDLAIPLLSADPMLAVVLRRHAAGRIRSVAVALASPVEDVRGWLPQALTHGTVSLAAAARHLHVSPRTLQERLRSAGTTWRDEVDEARSRLATELLCDSTMPVAAIAARLGYSDARAFRRAFHRRHGSSPADYRRDRW